MELINVLLIPEGYLHLESIKSYKYESFSTYCYHSGEDISLNKEIERRIRRNYAVLENSENHSEFKLGDKIPEEITQILCVLNRHAEQRKHDSNPVIYKPVEINDANKVATQWVKSTNTENHLNIRKNDDMRTLFITCLKSLQIGINIMNMDLIEANANSLSNFPEGKKILQLLSERNYGLALEETIMTLHELEPDG